ncbi:hypothetical protein BST95_11560 [Halioglobus japonicus]|uniref:DUF1722 domain-containing protein n=1 Tax=Halioglobus japonicus TaxID=930805 RepID=A0AAP8MFF9_9GAMM|nr:MULTISPECIES: DUF523 and DUF1722 domain-containing protein [Halioglobus]AQA18779.1 hypothetical protein BST95_11560 [Halioglobus japonicus]KZX60239.1 hypothetical protein A3709_13175 [Halioglobus sp. HI00S01]PLW86811.1 DUF1722 domain-containing protein [Halioglobus japonicus]GHD10948.1 hypothetical protein GCM10007052_10130 [Halioglobus japonicus]
MTTAQDKHPQPLVGIGSCLAGNEVRYDGQSKAANIHVQRMRECFDTRPFCPEMAIGLGVPRPPIQVAGEPDDLRVVDVATRQQDVTQPLKDFAQQVLNNNPTMAGYILVKGSPSCGFDRVKRFNKEGRLVARDSQGVFAATLATIDPLLPLEDDGRLNDPGLRESFVTRVFTYHQWRELCAEGLDAGKLVSFYSRHKYLVMAHDVPSYRKIGKMLANAGKEDIEELGQAFITELMTALTKRTSRRSHANVLFHIAGYLRKKIAPPERQRLSDLIEQYRLSAVPLIVPITLLKHHFANHPNAYIDQQAFLSPFPDQLQIRNVT